MHKIISSIAIMLLLTACASRTITSVNDPDIASLLSQSTYVEVPFIQQNESYTCGAAVLTSVYQYWDSTITIQKIFKEDPPASMQNGYSIAELKAISEKNGFRAFAFKADKEFILKQIQLGRPLITPLRIGFDYYHLNDSASSYLDSISEKYNHFVVVFGIDDKFVWVMDPVLGLRNVPIVQFLYAWQQKKNGIILITP